MKTERPQNKHLKPFKPGQSGNPNGREVGSKNFKTLYTEALIKIAKHVGSTPEEVENNLDIKAIEKALQGNLGFYIYVRDRLLGKVKEEIDMNVKGKVESALSADTIARLNKIIKSVKRR